MGGITPESPGGLIPESVGGFAGILSYLVKKFEGLKLPLEILSAREGWYIGTRTKDGSPYTQESVEIYATAKAAERAFRTGQWTQRQHAMGRRARKFLGRTIPVGVLSSRGGWYIGTRRWQYHSRESAERFSTYEAAERALNTGQWTERPDPSWRVRRRLLFRRVRQIVARYFPSDGLIEGLAAGVTLFALRWGFDAYLALLSGRKADAVLNEKLSRFSSEFIADGYIYIVAGALLSSLVWSLVCRWWCYYLIGKAYHISDENRWYRYYIWKIENRKIVDPLFVGVETVVQIAGVYLVLAAVERLDVWEKDYAAAVFGTLVFFKVLDNTVLEQFWGYAFAGTAAVFPAVEFVECFVELLPASDAAKIKFIGSSMLAGGLVGGVIGWARARGRPREQLYDAPFKVVASGLAGFYVSMWVVPFFVSTPSLFAEALLFAGGLLGGIVGYQVFYGTQAAAGSPKGAGFLWGPFDPRLVDAAGAARPSRPLDPTWGRALIGYGVAAGCLLILVLFGKDKTPGSFALGVVGLLAFGYGIEKTFGGIVNLFKSTPGLEPTGTHGRTRIATSAELLATNLMGQEKKGS